MTPLYSLATDITALVLLVTCMTLLFHPLLKHLALSEVPAAALICLCGQRYRRALAGILARRRLASRAPSVLPRPEKTKLPAAVGRYPVPRRPGIPAPRLDAYRAQEDRPVCLENNWAALAEACARRGENWRNVR